jgi:putative endonuclease
MGRTSMYWSYVLKSQIAAKSYVGSTKDLNLHLRQHNSGQSRFTKKYLPWELVYVEEFHTRIEALAREKYLKSKSGRKFLKSVIFK